jgi:hypothetical protein
MRTLVIVKHGIPLHFQSSLIFWIIRQITLVVDCKLFHIEIEGKIGNFGKGIDIVWSCSPEFVRQTIGNYNNWKPDDSDTIPKRINDLTNPSANQVASTSKHNRFDMLVSDR